METSRAINIFKHIENDFIPDVYKGFAIQEVMNMAKFNSITKEEMIAVIRYLFPFVYEVTK